jgi:hypothetical protein
MILVVEFRGLSRRSFDFEPTLCWNRVELELELENWNLEHFRFQIPLRSAIFESSFLSSIRFLSSLIVTHLHG